MALIYLDAWGIKNGPHGIWRYCRSLIPPLVQAAPHHRFVILRPRRSSASDRIVPSAAVDEVEIPLPRTDWATLTFRPFLEPAFRRYGRPDLYHSLFHMLPFGLRRGHWGPRAVIVTLHDLICLDYVDQVKRGRLAAAWVRRFDRAVIPYALRHADHVICVSEATRHRAAEWVPPDRSTTVHSGAGRDWRRPDTAATAVLPYGADRMRPYVAALGVARPYKNVACVVQAVAAIRRARPELQLVLIGGDGGAAGEIRRCALEAHVLVTPKPEDVDLGALVSAARVFVVASRAEGFGLPLLESMAVGTPVAASDIAPLREVGGDAALWFDPDAPEQLAAIIDRLLTDEALRAGLISRGHARAAMFPWSAAAARTLAVYDRVLERG